MYFTGYGSNVKVPIEAFGDLVSAGGMTVSLWAKQSMSCYEHTYFYFFHSEGFFCRFSGGNLQFFLYNNVYSIVELRGVDCSYFNDDWHYWTFVYNCSEGSASIYKDGQEVAAGSVSASVDHIDS
eukprot:Rmarinus@m.6903